MAPASSPSGQTGEPCPTACRTPSEALTLSEIRDEAARDIDILERRLVIVLSHAGGCRLGVLTRRRPRVDEASIAAHNDTGTPPADRPLTTAAKP